MDNAYPITSFYFSVRVSGNSQTSDTVFQEASGLSKEMGTEDVVSGGENRFKYRLPTGTSYQNLVLKRGVVVVDSPLIEWCQTTLDGGLSNPIVLKDILLKLLSPDGTACMSWNFVKAYPLKWHFGDLKSSEGEVLIETIEFAYRYFELDDPRDDQYSAVRDLFG